MSRNSGKARIATVAVASAPVPPYHQRRSPIRSGAAPLMPKRHVLSALLSLTLIGCTAPAGEAPAQDTTGYQFGSCGKTLEGPYEAGPVRSLYVPMRDGVRLYTMILT